MDATVARQLPKPADEDPGNCACNDSQDGVVLILDHRERAVLEAEALQEPQDDGGSQNDVPARLMKDQPRSQVARRTLPHAAHGKRAAP